MKILEIFRKNWSEIKFHQNMKFSGKFPGPGSQHYLKVWMNEECDKIISVLHLFYSLQFNVIHAAYVWQGASEQETDTDSNSFHLSPKRCKAWTWYTSFILCRFVVIHICYTPLNLIINYI